MDEGRRTEIELCSLLFATDDQEEGAAAFLEDREPEFTGQ
jgi:1,4-dihydroxy-2-naphthoyl-CoA synthase